MKRHRFTKFTSLSIHQEIRNILNNDALFHKKNLDSPHHQAYQKEYHHARTPHDEVFSHRVEDDVADGQTESDGAIDKTGQRRDGETRNEEQHVENINMTEEQVGSFILLWSSPF